MAIQAEQLKEIPDDMVDKIVRSFENDGAMKIVKEKMNSGRWAVTAEFDQAEMRGRRAAAKKLSSGS